MADRWKDLILKALTEEINDMLEGKTPIDLEIVAVYKLMMREAKQ